MKKAIYALKDTKSNNYGTIFLEQNNETAKRLITEAKIPYKKDMELYRLGTYDMEKGILLIEEKTFVANGTECIGGEIK